VPRTADDPPAARDQHPASDTKQEATPRLRPRQVLVIMAGLLLGLLLGALDQTIVATALPTIAGELHSPSKLSWVVTAYLLASTVSTPLWGKLGQHRTTSPRTGPGSLTVV
jgi:MFS family permease